MTFTLKIYSKIRVCLLTIAGVLLSSTAFANDVNPFAYDVNLSAFTIPASACQPASAAHGEKLRLINGAYIFENGVTGEAALICPLSLNGWQAGVPLVNQDFGNPTMPMSSFRVFYKDPNDCQSSVGVEVTLRYRRSSGMITLPPTWTSSQEVNPGEFCFSGISGNTTTTVAKNHSLKDSRLYHFVVRIKRSAEAQNPAFSGIDFPLNVYIPQYLTQRLLRGLGFAQ